MTEDEAIQMAREYFLSQDRSYGCAETVFMVLKEAFHLPEAGDPAPAMVFNGGFANSGGLCGAISGAAIAVGMLAERRMSEHRAAKIAAREEMFAFLGDFQKEFRSVNCRELTGVDFHDEARHQQFIEKGEWRVACMRQVEYVIRAFLPLADEAKWVTVA